MFEELCGKNAFHNVILATTMWDEVDKETGEAREHELKTKYWQAMLAQNSTTSRFMRTRESAFELIDPLIDTANKRSFVQIQQEMVDMRKQLPLTSAGQKLYSEMELLVSQREDLLCRIRDEMKRAKGDEMISEALQEEHQKLQLSLESTVNEMRRLKLPLGQRLLNMTDKFSNKFKLFMSMISIRSSKVPRIPTATVSSVEATRTTTATDSSVEATTATDSSVEATTAMDSSVEATTTTTTTDSSVEATTTTTTTDSSVEATTTTTAMDNSVEATTTITAMDNNVEATTTTTAMGNSVEATTTTTAMDNGVEATRIATAMGSSVEEKPAQAVP